MKINVTRWSPDTCGCVFDFEWDGDLAADQRVHTHKETIKTCPNHQVVKLNPGNHYGSVLGENQRKNKLHGQLLTISNLTESVTQEDGSTSIQFKKGMGFTYGWSGTDDARILTITVTGYTLTNQQKTSIQNWCNTNLGIGKVVIN